MKFWLTFLFSSFLFFVGVGQAKPDSSSNSPSQATTIDLRSPHFPGGTNELLKFLIDNLNIADSNERAKVKGLLLINIIIDSTGKIKEATVLAGINKKVNKEVERVFSIMPDWIPAIVDGPKTDQEFVYQISLNLGTKPKKK